MRPRFEPLGRAGVRCQVVRVRSVKAFDKTALVTMSVPKEFAMTARMFKPVEDTEEVACHE